MRFKSLVFGIALFVGMSSALATGPEHVEGEDDAGSLPGGAQITFGGGLIQSIVGDLGGIKGLSGEGLDLEDMYLILIKDPAEFSATTVLELGGSANFDTRLFLFHFNGNGLLGNDDTFIPPLGEGFISTGSTLGNAATDGTGLVITEPGLYFLAVTVSPRAPISDSGSIFLFESSTEVSGPDGKGGADPVIAWQLKEPTVGGCCVEDDSEFGCIIAFELDCVGVLGGEYQGDDTDCLKNPCQPPTGACCSDFECQIATEAECNGIEGEYLGDGTDCSDDPCQPPTGACCSGGECQVMTQAGCNGIEGQYLGDGTDCLDDPCQPPTGACCSGFTCEVMTEADCNGVEGQYLGDGTDCVGDPCGGGDPVCGDRSCELGEDCKNCPEDCGACQPPSDCCIAHETPGCDEPDCEGTVCAVDPFCCDDFKGEWDLICVSEAIELCGELCDFLPTGACCIFDDGVVCEILTENACTDAKGKYQGDDSVCDPDPCGKPLAGGAGAYKIFLSGVSFAQPLPVAATLVVKQGACPAPVNPNSNGVIPMLLAGQEDLDVTAIVLESLELRRCDGLGGVATPLADQIKIKDINGPSQGDLECGECACDGNQGHDGVDDLTLKFRTGTTLEALGLSVADGVTTLELTGELDDGRLFVARDCIVIVPAGAGQGNITVESNTGETFVLVTPLDMNIDSDGFTNFGRHYVAGTNVTLIAPVLSEGRKFLRWSVDGTLQAFGQRTIEVAITDSSSLKAYYMRAAQLDPKRPLESDGDLE